MAGKVWAQFISAYKGEHDYMCRNRSGGVRVRISEDHKIINFPEDSPISFDECKAAINEFFAAEHERYILWAKRKGIEVGENEKAKLVS